MNDIKRYFASHHMVAPLFRGAVAVTVQRHHCDSATANHSGIAIRCHITAIRGYISAEIFSNSSGQWFYDRGHMATIITGSVSVVASPSLYVVALKSQHVAPRQKSFIPK